MDAVFKALSDPTRRALLNILRDRAGQTLTELEQSLGRPEQNMTRFGVMKHLKVLEEATLVITRREGRFKYHYLNALPIQEVADRWMAPYAKPLARFALDLKNSLEGDQTMAGTADLVLETYIRTTQDRLWDALLNPDMTRDYYYCSRIDTNKKIGGPFRYIGDDGAVMLDGKIIEIEPKTRILTTFIASWVENAPPTQVLYEIEPMGDVCKLRLTHFDVAKAKANAETGWQLIVAGLKTLLETGTPLNVPDR